MELYLMIGLLLKMSSNAVHSGMVWVAMEIHEVSLIHNDLNLAIRIIYCT